MESLNFIPDSRFNIRMWNLEFYSRFRFQHIAIINQSVRLSIIHFTSVFQIQDSNVEYGIQIQIQDSNVEFFQIQDIFAGGRE